MATTLATPKRPLPVSQTARVFSAATVGFTTFFCGFPAGVALAAITLRRLGYDDEARDLLVMGAIGTIAFVTALVLLPDGIGNVLVPIVNIALLILLRRKADEAITHFSVQGNSIWYINGLYGAMIGLAVLGIVALLAVAESAFFALIG